MVAVVEGSDIILSDVYLSGQFAPCRDGEGDGGGGIVETHIFQVSRS